MEELLNKLIEKGRVPFGQERITKINRCEQYVGHWNWGCWSDENSYWRWKCARELVSKESGLWQFVCENALYSYTNCVWKGCEGPVVADYIEPQSYEYRLIESALCDEDKLEQFLLDNIKIGK